MINGTDASTFAGDGEATIFRSGWTYVAIGLMGLRSIKRAQRRTGEAVGEVTTRDKGWWHEDPQVKVQFRAHTGQLVTISTDRRRYEIGDSVDVVYDPADCENARVKPDAAGLSAPRRRAVCVLFILLGLGWELFRWSR